jgi:hypothetical protein
MATILQLRRGTTTQHSSFTGAVGEVTVDTTKDTIVVHDGTTAGGFPLAKESAISGFIDLSDLSVTDSGGDGSLAYNNTTGVFTYTGPSASDVRAHFSAGTGITITTGAIAVDTSTIATQSYVTTAINNLLDGAPAALDTLNELAAAINDDASYASTITTALGLKLDASTYTASDVLTKIKTVDGAGSGLDADLLDGNSSAHYRINIYDAAGTLLN